MEKNQPQVIIQGYLFNVDFEKKQFVRFDDNDNRFPFKKLEERNGFYCCVCYYGHLEQPDGKSRPIYLPKECIDNEKNLLDKAYARQFNEKSKRPHDLLLIDDKIEQRLLGQLPAIDVAGDKYIIDWRLKELRLETDDSCKIQLWNLELKDYRNKFEQDKSTYEAFYHVPSKKVVDIDSDITEVPKDVVVLQIPHELLLDPIGVAIRSRSEPTSLLRLHPIQDNLKAEVSPISFSWVQGLVRDNVERINKIQKAQGVTHKKKRGFRF